MKHFLCWPFLLLALFIVSTAIVQAQPVYFQRTYQVTIDEAASFSSLIESGHYDTANSDITAGNFQVTFTPGSHEIVLKQYARPMSTKDVRRRLEKDGLVPVTLEWLLAFGAAYPEVQRHYHVICLGSVWSQKSMNTESRSGGKVVERQVAPNQIAYLRGSPNERALNACLEGNTWTESACFACIKKP